MRARRLVCAWMAMLFMAGPGAARDYDIVTVKSGDTADVYFQINLSGTLYLDIRTKDGVGCANLWWITWPLGTIKSEGRHCGFVKLDIPGFFDLSFSSKLRASAESSDIMIGYSANEAVAHSIKFEFP
ncbi:hypothetical protein MZK49_00610 [Ensifer sesbaniae]|uniref:hypothetical protein n=1 Tax=Ensifer sesbaniae TaxID=1214071 RepID=UPI002000E6B5|nr:hypothetical protein [Ensifer sesbaniae]